MTFNIHIETSPPNSGLWSKKQESQKAFIDFGFFLHKILCTQNHFRCIPVHVENRAHKRKQVHITNNNIIQR